MTTIGQTVPGFRLPDANGTVHDLEPAPATVVYFTSNRCPACSAWQPRLADAATDYAISGVRFLAINVPCQFPGAVAARMPARDGEEGVRTALGQPQWRNITYLHGDTLKVARDYGALIVPDIFLLDADRVVRYRGAPDEAQFEPEHRANWLRGALDAVLAGREPPFVPDALNGCPIKY